MLNRKLPLAGYDLGLFGAFKSRRVKWQPMFACDESTELQEEQQQESLSNSKSILTDSRWNWPRTIKCGLLLGVVRAHHFAQPPAGKADKAGLSGAVQCDSNPRPKSPIVNEFHDRVADVDLVSAEFEHHNSLERAAHEVDCPHESPELSSAELSAAASVCAC